MNLLCVRSFAHVRVFVTHPDSHSTSLVSKINSDAVSVSNTGADEHESFITLNIMVVPTAVGHVQITVSQEASAAHVLAQVCQLCQLGSPNLYLLLHRDMDNIISPHQLVAEFSHTKELILVESKTLRRQVSLTRHANGPLPEQPKYKNAMDLISSYKASIVGSPSRPTPLTAVIILLWVDTTVSLHWMANGCILCMYIDADSQSSSREAHLTCKVYVVPQIFHPCL